MHTARRAGASIRQGFDHDVAAICDLLLQCIGSDVGKSFLPKTRDFEAAFAQEFFEAVEEFVASGFCDIQEADGQTI